MRIYLTQDDHKDIIKMTPDYSQEEIAEYIGCCRSAVQNVQKLYNISPMGGTRNRWTDEENKTLIDLANKGHSSYFISTVLNRTRSAVNVQASKLRSAGVNIPIRERGKRRKS